MALTVCRAALALLALMAMSNTVRAQQQQSTLDAVSRVRDLGNELSSLRGASSRSSGSGRNSSSALSKLTSTGRDDLLRLTNDLGLNRNDNGKTGVYGGIISQIKSNTTYRAIAYGTNTVTTLTSAEITFTEAAGILNGTVRVYNIEDFVQANLNVGNSSTSGPIVFWVWPTDVLHSTRQPITSNYLTFPWSANAASLVRSTYVKDYASFLELLRNGDIYFDVRTTAFPEGIVRGQIYQPVIKSAK